MNTPNSFILRCIQLARLGEGNVAPNPMVGAVIVHNDKIIGEGYHEKYGGPHAEVNAINSVEDKELLKESTIYVSLEPCAHYGKTPPCADLIIEKQIPKVVIGCADPFAKVNGLGIKKLKDAGIEVIVGIEEEKSKELNKKFFHFHKNKKPWVMLKWAQSADGFIDYKRDGSTPIGPNWITSEELRVLVHKWRSEYDAILVGSKTALIDNPKLNVRDWTGKAPLRIILDQDLCLPKNLNIFDNSTPTIIINEKENKKIGNTEYIMFEFDNTLIPGILNMLHQRNILSLMVEGGAHTLEAFVKEELWNEAYIFTGTPKFINGIKAPRINPNHLSETIYFGEQKLEIFKNKNNQ